MYIPNNALLFRERTSPPQIIIYDFAHASPRPRCTCMRSNNGFFMTKHLIYISGFSTWSMRLPSECVPFNGLIFVMVADSTNKIVRVYESSMSPPLPPRAQMRMGVGFIQITWASPSRMTANRWAALDVFSIFRKTTWWTESRSWVPPSSSWKTHIRIIVFVLII